MKILVVDEQRLVLKTLQDFLYSSGHEVYGVESVALALELKERGLSEVDVVILDPGPTEEQALKAVRETFMNFEHADILLMDHTFQSPFAFTHGIYAYLRKPVRLAELELLLSRIAQKRGEQA